VKIKRARFFSAEGVPSGVDPVKNPGEWKAEVGRWLTGSDGEDLARLVTERTAPYLGPEGVTPSQIRWVIYRRVKEEGKLKDELLVRLHEGRCSGPPVARVEGTSRKRKAGGGGGSDEDEIEEEHARLLLGLE
jgi:hypothetical protein